MLYTKLNKKNGQILDEIDVDYIEEGILQNSIEIDNDKIQITTLSEEVAKKASSEELNREVTTLSEELNREVTTLSEELTKKVSHKEFSDEDLTINYPNVENDIVEIRSKIKKVEFDTTSIESNILQVENSIENIETNVENTRVNLETTKVDVENIKLDIEDIKSNVNSTNNGVKASVEELKVTVGENKTNIDQVKTSIEGIDSSLIEVKATIDDVGTNLVAAKSTIDTVNADLVEAKTTIEDVKVKAESINENKYDDVSLTGSELSFKANGIVKKTITVNSNSDNDIKNLIIDDVTSSIDKTWSSSKIDTSLVNKINFNIDNTSNIELPQVDEKLNSINQKYNEISVGLNGVNEQLDNIMSIINNELSIKIQTFEGESIDADNTLINKTYNLQILGNSELIDGVENSVGEGIFDTTTFADTVDNIDISTFSVSSYEKCEYYIVFYAEGKNHTIYFDKIYTSYNQLTGFYYCDGVLSGGYGLYDYKTFLQSNGFTSFNTNNEDLKGFYLGKSLKFDTSIYPIFDTGHITPPTIAPTIYKIILVSTDKNESNQDTLEIILDEPLRSTIDGLTKDRIYQDEESVKLERKVGSDLQLLEEPTTIILEDVASLNLNTYNGYTSITNIQDSKKAIIKCNTIVRI